MRDTPAGLEADHSAQGQRRGCRDGARDGRRLLAGRRAAHATAHQGPARFPASGSGARVAAGTIADPSGDDGRVLSVNGVRVPPSHPRSSCQAGPAGQAEGAHRGRARLVMVGERRGPSATRAPNYGATNGATPPLPLAAPPPPLRRRGATPSGVGMAPRHLLHLRNNMRRYASAVAGARLCRSPSPPGVTAIRQVPRQRGRGTPHRALAGSPRGGATSARLRAQFPGDPRLSSARPDSPLAPVSALADERPFSFELRAALCIGPNRSLVALDGVPSRRR